MMGDKIEAKRTAKTLGIPVVPGSDGAVGYDQEATTIATGIGYPVLMKAAAGGGGRGMKVARTRSELSSALRPARAEAKAAFGDDAVYLENISTSPAISKSRCSATAKAMPCIWASAIAPCSAVIRRFWKKGPRRRSMPSARRCIGETRRQSDARARLSRSRHRRVPL